MENEMMTNTTMDETTYEENNYVPSVSYESEEPVYEEESSSGSGFGKFLIGGLITAGIFGGAKLFKDRKKIVEKRNEKMQKKLEKAGYTVYKAEEFDDSEVVVVEDAVSDEETTE